MISRQRRLLSLRQTDWNYRDHVREWASYRKPYTHRRRNKLTWIAELVVLLGFLTLAVWHENNTGFIRGLFQL